MLPMHRTSHAGTGPLAAHPAGALGAYLGGFPFCLLHLAAACTAARCAGEQLPPQADGGAANLRGVQAHVHQAAGCRVEGDQVDDIPQADDGCDESTHVLVEIAQVWRTFNWSLTPYAMKNSVVMKYHMSWKCERRPVAASIGIAQSRYQG